jgi:hypothetical protein
VRRRSRLDEDHAADRAGAAEADFEGLPMSIDEGALAMTGRVAKLPAEL